MAQHAHDNLQFAGSDPQIQAPTQREYDEPNHSGRPTAQRGSDGAFFTKAQKDSGRLANPLAGKTYAELERMGKLYAEKHQLGEEEDIRAFQKGACLAQDPQRYSHVAGLTGQELDVLAREFTHRWSQPRLLYLVIVLCSTCAAVQGMGMSNSRLHDRTRHANAA
jgi:hypothetical protein